MQWEQEILIVFQLIQKIIMCIGVKLGLIQIKIVWIQEAPQGYDEVNQARKAGYFGWPLFIGNNYPYHAYDYLREKVDRHSIRQNQSMIQEIILV